MIDRLRARQLHGTQRMERPRSRSRRLREIVRGDSIRTWLIESMIGMNKKNRREDAGYKAPGGGGEGSVAGQDISKSAPDV